MVATERMKDAMREVLDAGKITQEEREILVRQQEQHAHVCFSSRAPAPSMVAS